MPLLWNMKKKKKSPGGARNKQRGNELEREFVSLAHKYGLSAQRAWGSDGRSLGKDSEVDVEIEGYDLQIKRRKKIAGYLKIPPSCHCVGFKQDRGPLLILIPADLLFELLEVVE